MKTFRAAMMGLFAIVALAVSGPAHAAGKFSVETSMISDIVANPAAKAILTKDWPGFAMAPIDQVGTFSLRAISQYPQTGLDDATMKKIQADFDAMK